MIDIIQTNILLLHWKLTPYKSNYRVSFSLAKQLRNRITIFAFGTP